MCKMAAAAPPPRVLLLLAMSVPLLLLLADSAPDGLRLHMTSNVKPVSAKGEVGRRPSSYGKLAAVEYSLRVPSFDLGDTFHFNYSLGTPAVPLSAMGDSGSQLIWTHCNDPKLKGDTHLYDPSASSTAVRVPAGSPICKGISRAMSDDCTYQFAYADGHNTMGYLLKETLILNTSSGPVTIPGVIVGCTFASNLGNPGIIGLSRGKLSFITQLGFKKFSHCLTDPADSSVNPFFFGSAVDPALGATGRAQTVPFYKDPHTPAGSRYYIISLRGITVGSTYVDTPFERAGSLDGNKNPVGGLTVDSGSDKLTFRLKTYEGIRAAFIKEMAGFDLHDENDGMDLSGLGKGVGFRKEGFTSIADFKGRLPKVVLHLDGEDVEIPEETMYFYEDFRNMVWVMVRGYDGDQELSIWGNHQLRNLHVVYDIGNERMSFIPADCRRI